MGLLKKVGSTKQMSPASKPADTDQSQDLTDMSAPQTLPTGAVLQERYLIEGLLGVGGMSIVYRGRDLRFKDVVRLCAIKEMAQNAPDSQTRMLSLRNFEREAGLLATLHHPAIPRVYDFFEEKGRVYLILELVPGQDLETVLDKSRQPLEEARIVHWAVQVCDVLSYLHQHEPEPIVFRDMKPSNVMVLENDRIVLIDFGIARNFTQGDRKGTMIGTEGYSPPEQYRGVAEPQSDLYALGATMHHLLSGSDPRLETPFTFHERPIRQFNPSVSPELEAIIGKALEYDMIARWTSAEELKQALLDISGGDGGQRAIARSASGPRGGAAVATPSGSKGVELVWKFKCEDEVRSSPCISNGMLYVGCYDTNLYALDINRGEFRWKYPTQGGISSSPAVWQDIVIVGSEDGTVYALNNRQGTLRWSFQTSQPIRSSPQVEDRVIFIGSDDQHFYAIDGLRGEPIWQHRTWMPIRSSACIDGTSVYIGGNDGHVYCLDVRTGKIRWKQRTQQPIISRPTCSEGMVFVGSMDYHMYALDSEGGWPVWRYRTGHYVNSSPAIAGKRICFGGVDGNFYALEMRNGRLAWKYETGSQIASSPYIEDGRVYFGAVDGFVYCLDSDSGALIWKFEIGAPIVSSPYVADGVVYIGSMDYHIYALKC